MQHLRLSLGEVISVTAAITLTYMVAAFLELRFEAVLAFYLATLVSTVWMVIRILKDPYSTDKTFDEYFYQDREDIRRCGKE
jgi:hypothetical protein